MRPSVTSISLIGPVRCPACKQAGMLRYLGKRFEREAMKCSHCSLMFIEGATVMESDWVAQSTYVTYKPTGVSYKVGREYERDKLYHSNWNLVNGVCSQFWEVPHG